jgi:ATP-binding cassette subfamily F protein uup
MINRSPVLTIKDVTISFAKKNLFENLSLNIFSHDKICLIGKNGVGKSTLMNCIANKIEFDRGELWKMPNLTISHLTQSEKIFDSISVYDFIKKDLKIDDNKSYLIDIICEKLKINKNAITSDLSGGQKRRVNLAKSLIIEPDILLLDEPTNHLDIEIIEWLENYLINYKGALIIISHDRKFLEQISNKIFWIREGQIKINNNGYRNFDEWSENIINHEIRTLQNLEKKLELESEWLQTGVTARRKRNIGRLHYLQELRIKFDEQKRVLKSNQNSIKIENQKIEEDSPQLLINFNNISKSYPVADGDYSQKIIDKFSLKVLRGERIGIVGKNGSGKSTLLKLIINDIQPDSGNIKLAKDIKISYFDQSRSSITPNSSIQDILCESGSDYIQLANNKTRHICGYLRDFMFDPNDRYRIVNTLSGGQQNRLVLAKILANPGNLLILDEPTNDLDMDSMDILENYLEKYQGTLILVSHDREFLDNVVTSIIAFENNGSIDYCLGGYSDYLSYKFKKSTSKKDENTLNSKLSTSNKLNDNSLIKNSFKSKNKLKLELEKIIQKIEKIEKIISDLNNELMTTENRNNANLSLIGNEIKSYQEQLEKLEEKWQEIEKILNTN